RRALRLATADPGTGLTAPPRPVHGDTHRMGNRPDRRSTMRTRRAWWALVVVLGLGPGVAWAQAPGKLEIFSWWTTGGEAAGLLKLFELAKRQHPGLEIINATVAGGAGQNAKAVLKTRMLGGDPPDSFQVHMGRELIDTWVTTGFMEPLDPLFKQAGWEKAFPPGVLELLKHNGAYYSVPANIH